LDVKKKNNGDYQLESSTFSPNRVKYLLIIPDNSAKGYLKATSKNVIPAKAGIQKLLTLLDSRLRGSDKLIIIRGSLK
jgi:hypothetical protein